MPSGLTTSYEATKFVFASFLLLLREEPSGPFSILGGWPRPDVQIFGVLPQGILDDRTGSYDYLSNLILLPE